MPDNVSAFWASPPDSLHPRPVVAEALGVSTAKLERDTWLRKGLPVVRLVRQIRYRKRDVESYLNANTDRHSAMGGDGA